jgi:hypothetical protein
MTDFIFKKLKEGFETPEYRWSAMLNPAEKNKPKATSKPKAEKTVKAAKPAKATEKKPRTKKASSPE